MFSIPDAHDVLPNNRNHGLNPSELLANMILRCYSRCVIRVVVRHNKPNEPEASTR
jgi:hypothetical protein